MNILLLISVITLPSILGDKLVCYENAEAVTGVVRTEKGFCASQCMKSQTTLPDGTQVIFRGCGEFQWASTSIIDSLKLLPYQRKSLVELGPDSVYYCRGDFCNGVDSIVATSSLFTFIVAAIAIFLIN